MQHMRLKVAVARMQRMLLKEADTHAGLYETHAPHMQRMLLKETAAAPATATFFSFFPPER